MRKVTVSSVIVASLLLIGCGQEKSAETKAEVATPAKTETLAQKATKAVEATKEVANSAVAKAKEVVNDTATKAVETTKKVATAAAEKTAEVAKDAKKAVAKVVAPASTAPTAYSKCAGCHGKDGKMKALGKSEIIAGQAKADLVKKIGEYKAGTRNVAGMGALMKGQVAGLSDADIDAIATYVSGIK